MVLAFTVYRDHLRLGDEGSGPDASVWGFLSFRIRSSQKQYPNGHIYLCVYTWYILVYIPVYGPCYIPVYVYIIYRCVYAPTFIWCVLKSLCKLPTSSSTTSAETVLLRGQLISYVKSSAGVVFGLSSSNWAARLVNPASGSGAVQWSNHVKWCEKTTTFWRTWTIKWIWVIVSRVHRSAWRSLNAKWMFWWQFHVHVARTSLCMATVETPRRKGASKSALFVSSVWEGKPSIFFGYHCDEKQL